MSKILTLVGALMVLTRIANAEESSILEDAKLRQSTVDSDLSQGDQALIDGNFRTYASTDRKN